MFANQIAFQGQKWSSSILPHEGGVVLLEKKSNQIALVIILELTFYIWIETLLKLLNNVIICGICTDWQ